uniref:Uncharacterized protein n=1 Tax=Tanacetum cinerariifolium TaxID=118510 RepID=A0A699H3J2_TANCI|nr:hypothetical protein [Tanacetum cinerariifolium]
MIWKLCSTDRNSFSLVSHMCYDVDAKTRKHVTAHLCYATPLRFRQRFPFIESLTLARNPHIVDLTSLCNWDHNLTPWLQEIATSFKRLKVVRLQNLVVHDLDLGLLARTLGEKLRVLEIDSCSGFSTDGLLYIGIGYNCGYLLKRRTVLVAPGMPKLNLSRNVDTLRN